MYKIQRALIKVDSRQPRCTWGAVIVALALSTSVSAQLPPATQGAPQAGPPGGMQLPPVSKIQPSVEFARGVIGLMDVTYATYGGYRPLKLDLYYQSKAKAARPAIVWVHGGGWVAGSPRMGMAVFGAAEKVFPEFVEHGYVMAAVSYRLSSEAKFPAAMQDVKAAIRWLRANASKYNIDTQRIAVWGESAGGQLAALAGTSCGVKQLEGEGGNADQSSCVQAVVDWFGPTELSAMDAQNTVPNAMPHGAANSPESNYLGCLLSQCPASLLALANPITHINNKAPPFLIMHGDADGAVPLQQSRELYDALKAQGIKAQLEIVPGAGHGFAGASATQQQGISDKVYRFLDETLAVKPKTK